MFALQSEKKLETFKTKDLTTQNITDNLLLIYKKLKKIAKSEISLKNKFKLADLTNNQLSQLKSLETDLGFCLVAYKGENDSSGQKIQILTQINNLLNDYSKLLTRDDFSKFFE